MGNCSFPACFELEPEAPTQEDLEIRRQRQAEAAAKRQQQAEHRGVKNPELLRAKQARREEIERKAARSGEGGGGLKWTVS